jgi:hypothetical protein
MARFRSSGERDIFLVVGVVMMSGAWGAEEDELRIRYHVITMFSARFVLHQNLTFSLIFFTATAA